ncbi:TPA: hypothetical protein KDY48_002164 [Vibrio parahaemolyticus]|uniref:hypothetical protein n=1 Tax=Vibrio parahaemolyticus TaxID=670 RepID=UPI00186A0DC5|nr:hypothetical protein [Vibrio parahaemolyticus]HAS6888145.1 hypothetical protein [Vibrio parahaemolyticus]HBC3370962.1 hypothetical protein [Vibrio parahaemolyticus]HBC3443490.1 hypothetical protein [Vibrio parahaemolyticus]HBH7861061.1 hypothetical protein [Vibrio parahaemolyticus]
MQLEKQCYGAGVDAIQYIVDTRIQSGKSTFQRLDEDKNVPFVVPSVTWDSTNRVGSLNNEHWYFKVGYAFREALDLIFMERTRDKRKVNLWTQGCILSFQEGDLINSKDGKRYVQVKYASPMGWDEAKQEMFYGSVTFIDVDSSTGISETKSLTQLDFLKLLIEG